MATKIELETRIRELERRLENDEQDMVEVCERIESLEKKQSSLGYIQESMGGAIEALEKRIAELEQCKTFQEQQNVGVSEALRNLEHSIDTLCDVVQYVIQDKVWENGTISKLMKQARLPQEAQDKQERFIKDKEYLNDRLHKAEAELEQLKRERASGKDWNNLSKALAKAEAEVEQLKHNLQCAEEQLDYQGTELNAYKHGCGIAEKELRRVNAMHQELAWDFVSLKRNFDEVSAELRQFNLGRASGRDWNNLSKALAKAEAERDAYQKSSNDWARHFKMERTARISAEADRDAMRECVEVLKKAHKVLDHCLEDDDTEPDWSVLKDIEQALAKYEAQKGGE